MKTSMKNCILKLKNEDLRSICVSMYKKYNSETDLSNFEIFLREANQFLDYHRSLLNSPSK